MQKGMSGIVEASEVQIQSKQYDIVGSLPPELVLQIVKYLDADDVVRNQRVRIC